jgi:hypothetical protein
MKKIEPIISKPSTLNQKSVSVKGNTNFSRSDDLVIKTSDQKKSETTKHNESLIEKSKDKRFMATLTQKISPSVNLKLNTLKPFLGELEGMPKATINEIVELAIDNYVNSRLTTRQQEAFKSMYSTQIELLNKQT